MLNRLSQSGKHGRASSPNFGPSRAQSRLHGRDAAELNQKSEAHRALEARKTTGATVLVL